MCSISTPRAGFEPAFGLSVEDCFIQLSYRGDLSCDIVTNIFDNISNNNYNVNGKTRVVRSLARLCPKETPGMRGRWKQLADHLGGEISFFERLIMIQEGAGGNKISDFPLAAHARRAYN